MCGADFPSCLVVVVFGSRNTGMSLSEIDMAVEHRCVAIDVVNSVQRLAHVGLLRELLLVLR